MTIDLKTLASLCNPKKTILIFGAGASIPSGAPSSEELVTGLAQKLRISDGEKLSLPDIATVIEYKNFRRDMVEYINERLRTLVPARGLQNLPDFDWAGIYTTNFDTLIEKVYSKKSKNIDVISSNFDFPKLDNPDSTKLYKIHGTTGEDRSLGHRHSLILSHSDYEQTEQNRAILYNKFAEQLHTKNGIIIGQSLSDEYLKDLITRAIEEKKRLHSTGDIYIYYATKEIRIEP